MIARQKLCSSSGEESRLGLVSQQAVEGSAANVNVGAVWRRVLQPALPSPSRDANKHTATRRWQRLVRLGMSASLVTVPGANMANQSARLQCPSIPCREPKCWERMPCSGCSLPARTSLSPQPLSPVGQWRPLCRRDEQDALFNSYYSHCEMMLRQRNSGPVPEPVESTVQNTPPTSMLRHFNCVKSLAIGNSPACPRNAALGRSGTAARRFCWFGLGSQTLFVPRRAALRFPGSQWPGANCYAQHLRGWELVNLPGGLQRLCRDLQTPAGSRICSIAVRGDWNVRRTHLKLRRTWSGGSNTALLPKGNRATPGRGLDGQADRDPFGTRLHLNYNRIC